MGAARDQPRAAGGVEVHTVGAAAATDPAFVRRAASLLGRLVAGGAALGWLDPPDESEVATLLADVANGLDRVDACLAAAWRMEELAGLGYWRRYARPTHWPHADVEKVAVEPGFQGEGIGRRLMAELVRAARDAEIEVLTLDFRADNARAASLYRSLGFREYGRLPRFVAVGEARYDKVFYALDLRTMEALDDGQRPPQAPEHQDDPADHI